VLDGTGVTDIATGVGMFDHLLDAMCRFGRLDLTLRCDGDLHVDAHHTVEDCGLVLGQALRGALGDKRGITRAAHAYVPMDEALAFCTLDISGRPFLKLLSPMPQAMLGLFDAQLAEEFFRALTAQAGLTVHLDACGVNAHHMLEALFKAFGKALDEAARPDPRIAGEVPSTKGVL